MTENEPANHSGPPTNRAPLASCLWAGASGVGTVAFLIGQLIDPPTRGGGGVPGGGTSLTLFLLGGALLGSFAGAMFAARPRSRPIDWGRVYLGLAGLHAVGFLSVLTWPGLGAEHRFFFAS